MMKIIHYEKPTDTIAGPLQEDEMLIWIVAEDGTFIDETNLEAVPKVGEQLTTDRTYQVIEAKEQDESAKKLNAQVLVVKEA